MVGGKKTVDRHRDSSKSDISRREFLAKAAIGGAIAASGVGVGASTSVPEQTDSSSSRELALLRKYGGEFGDLTTTD